MNITGSAQANLDTKGVSPVSPVAKPEPAKKSEEAAREQQQQQVQSSEEQQATKMSRDEVEEMVEGLKDLTQTLQTKLNFSINESTNDVVVKILEKDTDKIIKQFPPEELLELQEKMLDLTGFLFDADV